MDASITAIIHDCHLASEEDRLDFPQILTALHQAGVEGYMVDFRRSTKTYYLSDGESLELSSPDSDVKVSALFDASTVEAAVREAQTKAPGYTYKGFCAKVMQAGCAGYIVSILGRRVVYFGRTAETHVEHFPTGK
ncbi:DUF1398 domain-containing protein [Asticcacaulis sp.]|uniref:DUF1398 domain-containing protein n=1 Tax=Asticcacaulis sp. TaxID=1872648 RepID=UPI002C6BC952|nr:DUF1398 family protein [Asticcacaulis sp.]HTM81099.1 DUF1398 family protein [Asticcacaulis sp.]